MEFERPVGLEESQKMINPKENEVNATDVQMSQESDCAIGLEPTMNGTEDFGGEKPWLK